MLAAPRGTLTGHGGPQRMARRWLPRQRSLLYVAPRSLWPGVPSCRAACCLHECVPRCHATCTLLGTVRAASLSTLCAEQEQEAQMEAPDARWLPALGRCSSG